MAYNPITEYRQASTRLRGIARNRGTTMATTSARQRAIADQDRAVGVLLRSYDTGYHIVGLLVEEAKLADRDWQNRPELKERMLKLRRELRELEAWL
jgi:hypothetical protein